ncbi:HAD hydrolase-like protein [Neobacillus sp. DY30]|uniref:HAD family hydrolase n=1 Tax=Neobacillus sp. DY30 TaxID=3047871 RepID=UPI0024C08314|nr:HAD hydrolase-like protein [Neobacillus sp. DY30]WHY03681.1 HAD hydrolase-like protein [Neobacillus sp. DY30]
MFSKALQELNVPPNQCVYVGDHPKNDVKVAQDVGIHGIINGTVITYYINISSLIKNGLPANICSLSANFICLPA